MTTLPADVSRCPGVGSDSEGWRDGCDVCLRRLAPAADHPGVPHMTPPAIIVFECQYLLEAGQPPAAEREAQRRAIERQQNHLYNTGELPR